jgi:hypothetical protein
MVNATPPYVTVVWASYWWTRCPSHLPLRTHRGSMSTSSSPLYQAYQTWSGIAYEPGERWSALSSAWIPAEMLE